MRLVKVGFIIIIVFFISYCVRARISPYPDYNFLPTNPAEVQVYYMPPSIPFEIIGEVEARGAPTASWDKVERYMRREASSIGGDAIVLVNRREEYAGTYSTPSKANAFVYGNYVYYTYQPGSSFAMKRKHVVGLVIKWKKKQTGNFEVLPEEKKLTKKITVYLKNGEIVKGEFLNQNENIIILKTSLGELKIGKERIASVEQEKKDVIIYLKDGSILKGKIISENEKAINIDTSLGELRVGQENILKREWAQKEQGGLEKTEIKEGDLVPLDMVDQEPSVIKKVTPKYSWQTTQFVTHDFKLNVLISEKGDVEEAEIIESQQIYKPINKAVIDAVKQWKFRPAIKDGIRVKVWKQIVIRINKE